MPNGNVLQQLLQAITQGGKGRAGTQGQVDLSALLGKKQATDIQRTQQQIGNEEADKELHRRAKEKAKIAPAADLTAAVVQQEQLDLQEEQQETQQPSTPSPGVTGGAQKPPGPMEILATLLVPGLQKNLAANQLTKAQTKQIAAQTGIAEKDLKNYDATFSSAQEKVQAEIGRINAEAKLTGMKPELGERRNRTLLIQSTINQAAKLGLTKGVLRQRADIDKITNFIDLMTNAISPTKEKLTEKTGRLAEQFKEVSGKQAQQVKSRVSELRKQGMSDEDIIRALREKGLQPSQFIK